jgi:gas vesicle protein
MGENIKTFASLYTGVLMGWMVGTTIGLVTAPRSGEEMQTLIRDRGQELKDKAGHRLEDARQKAEHFVRAGTNRATELSQQGQTIWREQKVSLLSAIKGVRTGVQVFAEPRSNLSSMGTDILPAPSQELSPYVQKPGEDY